MAGKPIASKDIVLYLNKNGAHTIVTDNLPVSESPAKKLSYDAWDISTADVDIIVNKCKKERVNAVFTGIHEYNIWRTLDVCEALNLPFYASREDMLNTSLKSRYKALFRKFDIPVVPEIPSIEDVNKTDYPVLVKPVDGSGGYGISICYDEVELRKGYKNALEVSILKKALIEKFIDAREVTIFYILQNGKIMLSALANRNTGNGDKYTIPLPVLYIFPSQHLNNYIKKLNNKVIAAFNSIGLKNGMIFIQSFIDNDEFMFYDIGFRLTGTQEYHILEHICEYNPLEMMVDYALTKEMGDRDIKHLVDPYFRNKYAFNITFLAMPCTIKEYLGIEEARKMPGVLRVIENHEVGTTIPQSALGTLNQVVVRVLAVCNSKAEMIELIKVVTEKIDVISTEGNSVVMPGYNLDEL